MKEWNPARDGRFRSSDPTVENIFRSGFVRRVTYLADSPIRNIYYGVNLSQNGEPIDQFSQVLAVRRAQELAGGKFFVFVAGKYGILNAASPSGLLGKAKALEEADLKKVELFSRAMKLYRVDGEAIPTSVLWNDRYYWECVQSLFEVPGIIQPGSLSRQTVRFGEIPTEALGPIPKSLLAALNPLQGKTLYTLLEVGEAKYMRDKYGVDTKIGPTSEERYDAFISEFMNIIQTFQPVSLDSKSNAPKTVFPYIARASEKRLTLDKDLRSVEVRVEETFRRSLSDQPVYDSDYGPVLNPVAQLIAMAIEAGRVISGSGRKLAGVVFRDGDEASEAIRYLNWAWNPVSRWLWDDMLSQLRGKAR